MRILSPRVHGYLDYAAVLLLILAPSLFGFSGVPAAASYILAAMQFGYSILTNYPLGAVKMIPFTVHGGIDFATAVVMAAMPWLAGFNTVSAPTTFFVAAGIGLFLVWLITDYRAADIGRPGTPSKAERRVYQAGVR